MKSIELFAGFGGISLAAEWAGIETLAFCERDQFCQKILSKHWPDVPIFDDIKTLNKQAMKERGIDVDAIELISGGFPCQPYSIAGKRKGTSDDRDLWPEMFRIIEEIRPTWVVGENVANFVNMELDRTLFDLESIGYKSQSFVIPACGIGAKHRRERTFVVAYADNGRHVYGQTKEQPTETRQHAQREFIPSCPDVAYTNSQGLEGKDGAELESHHLARCSDVADSKNQGNVWRDRKLRKNEGIGKSRSYNRRRTKTDDSGEWWAVEPDVGRVAHGIPNRVDRLRGLGNAVVPQQIYPIFEAIMKIG